MECVRRFLIVGVLLTLPVMAFAQEATLTGTVTDATGGVLPGVTVTAVNDATGNTFTAVTDDLGIYRIPVRVGAYRITVELVGLHHGDADGRAAARRTDGVDQRADDAVDRAGNRHRHRRSAAAQRDDVEPRAATSIQRRCRSFR